MLINDSQQLPVSKVRSAVTGLPQGPKRKSINDRMDGLPVTGRPAVQKSTTILDGQVDGSQIEAGLLARHQAQISSSNSVAEVTREPTDLRQSVPTVRPPPRRSTRESTASLKRLEKQQAENALPLNDARQTSAQVLGKRKAEPERATILVDGSNDTATRKERRISKPSDTASMHLVPMTKGHENQSKTPSSMPKKSILGKKHERSTGQQQHFSGLSYSGGPATSQEVGPNEEMTLHADPSTIDRFMAFE